MNDTINDNDSNINNSNTSFSDDNKFIFRRRSDLDRFESFGSLSVNDLFTDLAISCAGQVFRCHRLLMVASSAYIKKALNACNSSDNKNCNSVIILPEEIKGRDMEAILQFIYNGQIEVRSDVIESFLSSAKALQIKGLANLKLVYNNNHINHYNNQNKIHNYKNNKNRNSNTNQKTINNKNQNSNNFIKNIVRKTNNNSNKRNIIIGGTSIRSPNLKSHLNSCSYLKYAGDILQNQNSHSSLAQTRVNSDSQIITRTAHKKQKVSHKSLATKEFPNDTKDENESFVTMDEQGETQNSEILNDTENRIIKNGIKMEDNSELKKISVINVKGTELAVSSKPCLIQIDSDLKTLQSLNQKNNVKKFPKRGRISSLRLGAKNVMISQNNSLVNVNRNSDKMAKQKVRTSIRKLGFIQFHKNSTTIWNPSNNWKCEICNKFYGKKQTLKEHMDYFHSNKAEKIFACHICTRVYAWRKSLMKHYRDNHQINPETSFDIPEMELVTQSRDKSHQLKLHQTQLKNY